MDVIFGNEIIGEYQNDIGEMIFLKLTAPNQ